jgi:hypothetical protein
MSTYDYTVKTRVGELQFNKSDVVNPDEYFANGDFNPHHVRPFLIHNEFGVLCVVYAQSEQDALDEAVDANRLDSCLVSAADYQEAEQEGHADEFANLGNAGEPFDLTYIGVIELKNAPYGDRTEDACES